MGDATWPDPPPLDGLEAELQRAVEQACGCLGIEAYHDVNPERQKRGKPDLLLVGRYGACWAELKSKTGKRTRAQEQYANRLTRAGHRVYVWRPDDWPFVVEVLEDLAGRAMCGAAAAPAVDVGEYAGTRAGERIAAKLAEEARRRER